MEPVSERGVFLENEPNSKAYRVLRERDGRVIVSRDVIVDERGPSGIVELGSDPEKEKVEPLDRGSPPTQPLDQGVPGGIGEMILTCRREETEQRGCPSVWKAIRRTRRRWSVGTPFGHGGNRGSGTGLTWGWQRRSTPRVRVSIQSPKPIKKP